MEGVSPEVLETIRKNMPDMFLRKDVERVLYGLLSRTTLATLESKKCGPPSYRAKQRTIYLKETFMPWLEQYYKKEDDGDEGAVTTVHCGEANETGSAKGR